MTTNLTHTLLLNEVAHQKKLRDIISGRVRNARQHVQAMEAHLERTNAALKETRREHTDLSGQAMHVAKYLRPVNLGYMETLTIRYATRIRQRMNNFHGVREARNSLAVAEADLARTVAKITQLEEKLQMTQVNFLIAALA